MDKAKLLAKPAAGKSIGEVTIPGVGVIKIRPLTRLESLRVYDATEEKGKGEGEAVLLHLGMVDPRLSLEEVREWQGIEGSSTVIQPVSQGIGVISGLSPGAGKEAYKSPR